MRLRFDRPWQWLCCLVASFLPVFAAPSISQGPASRGVAKGDSVTLSVTASGTGTLSYQWSHAELGKASVALSGQTAATLAVTVNSATDLGVYEVAVTDSTGTSRATALLQPSSVPAGSISPARSILTSGASVTLSSSVTGGLGGLSYQWRFNGFAISGATSSSLSLGGVHRSDAGTYDVVITDDLSSVVLPGATVGVGPSKTFDRYSVDEGFALHTETDRAVGLFGAVPLSSGRIIVAGGFSRVGGQQARGFACFKADGSVDSTFKAVNGGYAMAVAELPGDRFLVWDQYSGTWYRYSSDGRPELELTGSMPPGWAFNLVRRGRDGSLYISAQKGQEVRIFRYTSAFELDEGFVSPSFKAASGGYLRITQLLEQADGHLLVAGAFDRPGASTMGNLVRLNHDGSLDTSFGTGSGFDAPVFTLELAPDGAVLVGGDFLTYDGVKAQHAARLEGLGILSATWSAAVAFDSSVLGVWSLPDGRVLVRGSFSKSGSSACPNFALLKADGSFDGDGTTAIFSNLGVVTPCGLGQSGQVLLYSAKCSDFAWFDPVTMTAVQVPCSLDVAPSGVWTLPDGGCYVSGAFTRVNGASAASLARIRADGQLDSSFDYSRSGLGVFYDQAFYARPDRKVVLVSGNKVYRLLSDGSLDSSFSGPTLPYAYDVRLSPLSGGRVLVWATIYGNGLPMVLREDGSVDEGFAHSGSGSRLRSALQQPDGGAAFFTDLDGQACGETFNKMMRVGPDGRRNLSIADPSGAMDFSFVVPLPAGGFIATGIGGCLAVSSSGRSTLTSAGSFSEAAPLVPLGDGSVIRLPGPGIGADVVKYDTHFQMAKNFQFPRSFRTLVSAAEGSHAADAGEDGSVYACSSMMQVGGGCLRFRERTTPVVLSEPCSQQAMSGNCVRLSYQVEGAADGAVTWYKDGQALGASGETLVLADVSASMTGSYHAIYRDSSCSLTSATATLTVISGTFAPAQGTSAPSFFAMEGAPLHLEVVVSGSSLVYQWSKDGVVLPGAVSRVYDVASCSASDAGSYHVRVSNGLGAVDLDLKAYVTAPSKPSVSVQPSAVTVNAGEMTSFVVSLGGSGPFQFQWRKNGVDLPGETFGALKFLRITPADAADYQVLVTNSEGSVLSTPVTLTVNASVQPVIGTQPQPLAVAPGASASFRVTASGANLLYQWYRNGVAIASATGDSYSLSRVADADAAQYSVRVYNAFGAVESAHAGLMVGDAPPTLGVDPMAAKALTLGAGDALSLQVKATGSGTISYQWYKDQVALPGATAATYAVAKTARTDAGSYTCVVSSGALTVTSDAVAVTVEFAPVILAQPAPLSVATGAAASLSVSAEGQPAPAYQWYKDAVLVNGATRSTFSLSSAAASDAGLYTVVVSNTRGSVTSSSAKLTVSSTPVPVSIAPVVVRNLALVVGDRLELHVSVSGVPTPTCQWSKGGVEIQGATTDTLVIPAVTEGDAGIYQCKAGNGQTSATSDSITVTVSAAQAGEGIQFLLQPASCELTEGAKTELQVLVAAPDGVTYQWMRNGVALPAASNPGYLLDPLHATDTATYSCVATRGTTSVESLPALVRVHSVAEPPVVLRNPVDRLVPFTGTIPFPIESASSQTDRFQVRRNGVATVLWGVAGNFSVDMSTSGGEGIFDYEVSNAAGAVLSGMALIQYVDQQKAPVIISQPVGVTLAQGHPLELRVSYNAAIPSSVQWYRNGAPLSGETYGFLSKSSLTQADAGDYTVAVTDPTGTVLSQPAHVTVLAQSYAGFYSGTVGTDGRFLLLVREDNSAVLAGVLPSDKGPVLQAGLAVQPDGSLSTDLKPVGAAADVAASRLSTILTPAGRWSGTLATASASLAVTGRKGPETGSVSRKSGLFSMLVPGGTGQASCLVSPEGKALLVGLDGTEAFEAEGTAAADGGVVLTCADGRSVTGTIQGWGDRAQLAMKTSAGGSRTLAGAVEDKVAVQRLMNVSTRCLSGAESRVLTCGFVVGGTANKLILLRAVGPGLEKFGVGGLLKAPLLQLYNGSTLIGQNKGWANDPLADGIAYAASRVGAFALDSKSADAAILVSLPPGSYTTQAKGEGEEGNVLVEAYDLSADTRAQRIMNLSTRAWVGKDDQTLAAGFVVGGQAPRRVLIRATGPTLELFGLAKKDLLAHPKLKLYRGTSFVAEASDWASSPDAALISSASKQVGAFDFASDLEAAMVISLEPGAYSAQVVGANGETGVAIVEVYELP